MLILSSIPRCTTSLYLRFHFPSLSSDPLARVRAGAAEQAMTGVSVGSCSGISLASGLKAAAASTASSSKMRFTSFCLTFFPLCARLLYRKSGRPSIARVQRSPRARTVERC